MRCKLKIQKKKSLEDFSEDKIVSYKLIIARWKFGTARKSVSLYLTTLTFFPSELGKNQLWNKNAQLYSLIPYEKFHSMQKNIPAMWNIFGFKIAMFYLNLVYNVIYSCDGKSEFFISILLVFSVTWSFRNYSKMLICWSRNSELWIYMPRQRQIQPSLGRNANFWPPSSWSTTYHDLSEVKTVLKSQNATLEQGLSNESMWARVFSLLHKCF